MDVYCYSTRKSKIDPKVFQEVQLFVSAYFTKYIFNFSILKLQHCQPVTLSLTMSIRQICPGTCFLQGRIFPRTPDLHNNPNTDNTLITRDYTHPILMTAMHHAFSVFRSTDVLKVFLYICQEHFAG